MTHSWLNPQKWNHGYEGTTDIECVIGVHPCVNTSSLKLRLRDLLEKFLPAVDHGYTAVEL